MHTLRKLLTGTALALMLGSAPPLLAQGNSTAIFVVIENGGVVSDRDAALTAISFTLGELAELRRKRDGRGATIHLILSATPTEITWSGTPRQLFDQGHAVLEQIVFRDSCSDLVLAYQQVEVAARITRPAEIEIIGIGPFIHAGYPCDHGSNVISLPQAIAPEIKLGSLALQARFLRLLNVHADQDEMILDHLDAAGVMARVEAGELDFDLLDPARTRSALGSVLGGR